MSRSGKSLYKSILDKDDAVAARIKQASTIQIVQTFCQIQEILNRNHEMWLLHCEKKGSIQEKQLCDDAKVGYINSFARTQYDAESTPKYLPVIEELLRCNTQLVRDIADVLSGENAIDYSSLMGE